MRPAPETRCLDWRRDTDLERTHHCRECGQEVCSEYLTDSYTCDKCNGEWDWAECDECAGRGRIALSNAKQWVWKDSRSLQCTDLKFLCGDCHQGTKTEQTFQVWGVADELHLASCDRTLAEASDEVGKRNNPRSSVAIMDEANTLEAQLRF